MVVALPDVKVSPLKVVEAFTTKPNKESLSRFTVRISLVLSVRVKNCFPPAEIPSISSLGWKKPVLGSLPIINDGCASVPS